MDYYAKAIDYIWSRLGSPYFFVFSDDIAWCKANFQVSQADFVDISAPVIQPMTDFQLMGLCRHHIITNSTFSWWPAWLNKKPKKIVATPYRWFNDEVMNVQAVQDTIPENWIRIEFSS